MFPSDASNWESQIAAGSQESERQLTPRQHRKKNVITRRSTPYDLIAHSDMHSLTTPQLFYLPTNT